MVELTAEQRDIKMAAQEFAEKEFRDIARELEAKEEFDDRIWKKTAENGFLAVFVPEEYGGQGLGHFEQCLILEEFARVDLGITHQIDSTFFGAQFILFNGTEEQKKKYLPPVCEGKWRIGMASTEPEAGSDVASIATTATKDGDYYVLRGNKVFITNCTTSDFLVVLCVTTPEAKRKHERLGAIVVDTKSPGYEATTWHGKLSLRCSTTGEVAFNDMRVPRENLLGEEGKGFYYLMDFFNHTRLGVAAFGVGTAQGALDKAVAHVKKRKQFGATLAALGVVQTKIAEMGTMVETARSLLYRAALKADRGEIDPALVAMSKWYASEVAVKVADEAIQLHGGSGILVEYDVEHYWRDAKVLEIFEGTKEIEKLLIGRRLLGLH
ncbi:MAG TPA: acyl-CoA dehydrogenase family protein [Syntrophorhabdus sp.]|nr:acyl-CoA/acyl-ACP dehydrogenase [Syntrophorhabdus sp.]MDI9556978.1 acyl-CoA dehydrogenase family protein [Pseudomonadota bacterium]OPX93166.1 MAG: Acyl-CoA dehydrogenase [Syntrophorhabdus sp. PtaB.Bin027]OQB75704.1 MAG: Acyl-CoA dehydrogenase [Deltaproteobacteria bacterium ADurb.Bin135]HNQ46709.1 acyl-CoA dehydrogenase family protein [Syntrophorhabdus sp.]